ncbi:HAMP domain-containing histidine kinase [Candidatus Thorarchaeota archaeon]|nr:MAG: HAMP domain-containing histidine kinase [Candidatus Thorarchaeota archaeon]
MLIIISIVSLYILWITAVMPLGSSFDEVNLVRKGLQAILMLFLVIFAQRIKGFNKAFVCLTIGLSILLLGEVENFLDVLYGIEYNLGGMDLEDTNIIGLVLTVLGLILWTNELAKSRDINAQHQRETELYATLLRHDLRNDLQVLLGYIELMMETAGPLDSKNEKLMESSKAAAMRMSRLVKAFAVKTETNDLSLVELVKSIVSEAEATHFGLKFKLSIGPGTDKLKVYGGSLLRAAFDNLFRNSHQYAGDSAPVTINLEKVGTHTELIICDNGPGIPEEQKPYLFVRGSGYLEGGLGLYLTITIIRGCGGDIELIESPTGTGAAFRVILPIS